MKQGKSGTPGHRPPLDGDMDVEQLKRLIEIQTQVVALAKQNELAERKRQELQRRLAGRRGIVRRLLAAIIQFAQRNRPADTAS